MYNLTVSKDGYETLTRDGVFVSQGQTDNLGSMSIQSNSSRAPSNLTTNDLSDLTPLLIAVVVVIALLAIGLAFYRRKKMKSSH